MDLSASQVWMEYKPSNFPSLREDMSLTESVWDTNEVTLDNGDEGLYIVNIPDGYTTNL